ncbi:hypothetical protein ACOMHN_015945 [Nucella lapillus]
MVPSASPAARSEMRTAGSASGSASAGTSPVLCRRDTALTQSDPVKVSSDDPLRPDPAMDRTDSVMVMGDLKLLGMVLERLGHQWLVWIHRHPGALRWCLTRKQ